MYHPAVCTLTKSRWREPQVLHACADQSVEFLSLGASEQAESLLADALGGAPHSLGPAGAPPTFTTQPSRPLHALPPQKRVVHDLWRWWWGGWLGWRGVTMKTGAAEQRFAGFTRILVVLHRDGHLRLRQAIWWAHSYTKMLQKQRLRERCIGRYLWDGEFMRFSAVDADGDVSCWWTQLLVETAISANPQILLCDLHLKATSGQYHHKCSQFHHDCYHYGYNCPDAVSLWTKRRHLQHTGNQIQAWSRDLAAVWWWKSCSPSQRTTTCTKDEIRNWYDSISIILWIFQ